MAGYSPTPQVRKLGIKGREDEIGLSNHYPPQMCENPQSARKVEHEADHYKRPNPTIPGSSAITRVRTRIPPSLPPTVFSVPLSLATTMLVC